MSTRHTSLGLAFALTTLSAAPAAAQFGFADSGRPVRWLVRDEVNVRMPLAFEVGQRRSWSLRRNGWNPLAPRPEGERPRGPLSLRIDLEVAEQKEDGAWLLELVLSPLAPEAGTRTPDWEPLVLVAQVDGEGTIRRLQPREVGSAPAPVLPIEELRVHLEAILGAGLHERVLAKGDILELGEPGAPPAVVAASGRIPTTGLEAALLRLDAVRQARGERTAVFSLLQPAAEPSGDELGRTVGEASYVAADGLLRTFSYKPRRAQEDERAAADWLVIERIEARPVPTEATGREGDGRKGAGR